MPLNVTFQNLDQSQALTYFIEKKTTKLKKFLAPQAQIEWIVVYEDNQHEARLNLFSRGRHLNFKETGGDIYQAVNKVLHTANRILSKKKNRAKNRIRKRRTLKNLIQQSA